MKYKTVNLIHEKEFFIWLAVKLLVPRHTAIDLCFDHLYDNKGVFILAAQDEEKDPHWLKEVYSYMKEEEIGNLKVSGF